MSGTYGKVAVCLDGTEMQDVVLERAVELAKDNGVSEVHAIHVIDATALEMVTNPNTSDIIGAMREAFMSSVRAAAERIESEDGIKIEFVVYAGRIKERIADALADVAPDVVVCGNRGLSSIKYALLGSVSTFIIRQSPCDVLVVK